jgi:hypothetical protein
MDPRGVLRTNAFPYHHRDIRPRRIDLVMVMRYQICIHEHFGLSDIILVRVLSYHHNVQPAPLSKLDVVMQVRKRHGFMESGISQHQVGAFMHPILPMCYHPRW